MSLIPIIAAMLLPAIFILMVKIKYAVGIYSAIIAIFVPVYLFSSPTSLLKFGIRLDETIAIFLYAFTVMIVAKILGHKFNKRNNPEKYNPVFEFVGIAVVIFTTFFVMQIAFSHGPIVVPRA